MVVLVKLVAMATLVMMVHQAETESLEPRVSVVILATQEVLDMLVLLDPMALSAPLASLETEESLAQLDLKALLVLLVQEDLLALRVSEVIRVKLVRGEAVVGMVPKVTMDYRVCLVSQVHPENQVLLVRVVPLAQGVLLAHLALQEKMVAQDILDQLALLVFVVLLDIKVLLVPLDPLALLALLVLLEVAMISDLRVVNSTELTSLL